MDFGYILLALCILIIICAGIMIINDLFTDKKLYTERNILDVPFDKDILVIFSRSKCIYCEKLDKYIHDNRDKIKLNVVTVNFTDNTREYSDSYDKLDKKEQQKIQKLIEENEKNPLFGFPTMYKNVEILKGFNVEKIDSFFEIN